MDENRRSGPAVQTEREFYDGLYAFTKARFRQYLHERYVDDCTSCFITRLWSSYPVHLDSYRSGSLPKQFLETCVRNFACNFAQQIRRQSQVEISLQSLETMGEVYRVQGRDDRRPCEAEFSRAEVRRIIASVLDTLDEQTRTLIKRRYVDGEPWATIGASFGQSPVAVRMRAVRSITRLRNVLCEKGVTDEDAGELLG